MQALQDAIATLSALSGVGNSPSDSDQDESNGLTFAEEIQRLHIWCDEHEVEQGKLDHKLREASHLREQVLSLLSELSSKNYGSCWRIRSPFC